MGNYSFHPSHASPFAVLKWTIYFSVPAILWAGVNFQTLRDYFNASATLDQNLVEVAKLESEYAVLQREREMLDLGGFPAEKAIRERFKMVLPGEGVIFFKPESDVAEGRAEVLESVPLGSDGATTRSIILRSLHPVPSELQQE